MLHRICKKYKKKKTCYIWFSEFLYFSLCTASLSWVKDGNRMVGKLGVLPWKGLYAVVSLIGFILICWGYRLTRQNPMILFEPTNFSRYFAIILMLFVFPLVLAANFPGRIKSIPKHPLLAATKIWAFAHLLTNGTLADSLLFGSFLVWAIMNRISMKKRSQRPILNAPNSKYNDIIVVIGGIAIYLSFIFWAHSTLISVPIYF